MSILTHETLMKSYNKLNSIHRLKDVPVYYSEYACEPEYEMVKRSLLERLFTRPWQPRRKYNRVMVSLNPEVYKIRSINGYYILAHTSLREQLQEQSE